MSELELWIDNRPLSVSVSDGDEQKVRALADELTQLISKLRTQSTGAAEMQLLHLTALTLADEKYALQQKIDALEAAQVDRDLKAVQRDEARAAQAAQLQAQITQLTAEMDALAAPAAPSNS